MTTCLASSVTLIIKLKKETLSSLLNYKLRPSDLHPKNIMILSQHRSLTLEPRAVKLTPFIATGTNATVVFPLPTWPSISESHLWPWSHSQAIDLNTNRPTKRKLYLS